MQFYLDFEKPLVELNAKIRDLREYSTDNVDFSGDIEKLEKKPQNCGPIFFQLEPLATDPIGPASEPSLYSRLY